MLIRNWENSDNLKISILENLCFSCPWTKESIDETSSLDNFVGVVCENNGEVIGYAGAIFALDQADIALVAVSPLERRKGYAFEMLAVLIDKLKEKSVKNVFLEVRKSNLGAQFLYKKCGFNSCGIRKNYYENTEDAIVMVKEIIVDK